MHSARDWADVLDALKDEGWTLGYQRCLQTITGRYPSVIVVSTKSYTRRCARLQKLCHDHPIDREGNGTWNNPTV